MLFFLVLLTACGQSGNGQSTITTPSPAPTPAVTLDAYGTAIVFPNSVPLCIVSLVPNISVMLGALGLQGRVVGIDYYTNYPANLTSLPKVSDVNGKYDIEQIVALKPDLMLSYGPDTSSLIGRPGPLLAQGLECLAQIFHLDKFPGALPADCIGTV